MNDNVHNRDESVDAEDDILRWCRSGALGKYAVPAMRNGHGAEKGTCLVVDVACTERDPTSKYDWKTRCKRYAVGATWTEVKASLIAQKLMK